MPVFPTIEDVRKAAEDMAKFKEMIRLFGVFQNAFEMTLEEKKS